MFEGLQSRLEAAFRKIKGRGRLSPEDIDATLREVRMALLEADVHFKVAKDLCAKVAERAKDDRVLKSLTPDEQVVKLVYEELVEVMGESRVELDLGGAPPVVLMLVGLQGSGKTTTAGKLAKLLKDQHKRHPLLVSVDVYRPAAIDQLKVLGKTLDIPVFNSDPSIPPAELARRALEEAKNTLRDVLILDTAGRLQIDDKLMHELVEMRDILKPQEILLVADAMTGQEAVNVAGGFKAHLPLTGLVLTKMDGDARGGAALSMHAVTGAPIKFVGMGEKLDALDAFHPARLAQRILGMGDLSSLLEKAQREVSLEDSLALHKKLKKDEFSLDDFLNQLRTIRRMGSIASLASMIPGMNKMMKGIDPEAPEKELKRVEAIILSMTPEERRNQSIINGSRRKRIAQGSGTTVHDVNQLLKQFVEMRKVMRHFAKGGMGQLLNMFKGGGGGLPF